MSKEIQEKILIEINARIAKGKLEGRPEDVLKGLFEKEGQLFPYMNEKGKYRNIANKLGVSTEEDAEKARAPEAFCKIKDLPTLIGDGGPENISIKGKVLKSWIDRFTKKEGEGEWIVAKMELADETGSTLFTQFYDEKFGTLFHQIETGDLDKKVIVLHNIKVDVSMYSVHETSVQLRKYGKIELSDDEMDVNVSKHEPSTMSNAVKGKCMLCLVKATKIDFRQRKDGTSFCSVNCIDQDGNWVSVTIWSCASFTKDFKIVEGDILLVEGVYKEDEVSGKAYKKLNVSENVKVKINPKGYDFKDKGKTVSEKALVNAEIGDLIETTVLFNKIFSRKPFYLACPAKKDKGKECSKGVSVDENNTWKCNGGHVLSEKEIKEVKRVGMLSGILSSEDTKLNFTLFDRDGTLLKKVIGLTVDEFSSSIDKEGEERQFEALNDEVRKYPFKIKARVSEDNFKGSISLTIEDAEKIDIAEEIERFKASIKTVV